MCIRISSVQYFPISLRQNERTSAPISFSLFGNSSILLKLLSFYHDLSPNPIPIKTVCHVTLKPPLHNANGSSSRHSRATVSYQVKLQPQPTPLLPFPSTISPIPHLNTDKQTPRTYKTQLSHAAFRRQFLEINTQWRPRNSTPNHPPSNEYVRPLHQNPKSRN